MFNYIIKVIKLLYNILKVKNFYNSNYKENFEIIGLIKKIIINLITFVFAYNNSIYANKSNLVIKKKRLLKIFL